MGLTLYNVMEEFVYGERDKRKRRPLEINGPILYDMNGPLAYRGDFGIKSILIDNLHIYNTSSRHAHMLHEGWDQDSAFISFDLLARAQIDVWNVNVKDYQNATMEAMCARCGKISSFWYNDKNSHKDGSELCPRFIHLNRSRRTVDIEDYSKISVSIPEMILFSVGDTDYLSGIDRSDYVANVWGKARIPFLCELPRRAQTINEAVSILKPDMDFPECAEVIRQGNLYFVETYLQPRQIKAPFQKGLKIGRHRATEGKIYNGKIYVRGCVYHDTCNAYDILRLGKRMFQVYENKAVRRWKI